MVNSEQYDNAMLEYMIQIGAMQPEEAAIQRQRATVDALRQGGQRTPGMRDSGRMIHAANPLEFVNQVAQSGLGEYKNKQADVAQDAYGVKRRGYLEALSKKMMPPQPTAPGAPAVLPYDPSVGGY